MMRGIKKITSMLLLAAFCMTHSYAAQTADHVNVLAGMQNQAGGSLTLTETEAGMFEKGDLIFTVAGGNAGIYLDDVDVAVTGGIKGAKTKVTEGKNGQIKVTLKRETKEASQIILSGFVFTVDRTVPEGSYDLEISGSAITSMPGDDEHNKIVIKDFIRVATPNTEELPVNGLRKGSSSFTVGLDTYLLDGLKVPMNGRVYVAGKGYIMVPVRYVAQAFGTKDENILFGDGTVTIFAGGRTLSLTSGSNKAFINGAEVTLEVPVEIQDGRTYVPAGQIAGLLGLKCEWNEADKTATFIH